MLARREANEQPRMNRGIAEKDGVSRKVPVKTTLNKMLFCRHGKEDRGYDGLVASQPA